MVRVRRAAKKEEGAKRKRGCEKKGGAPHPPFFKKGGARSTGTPPEYAYVSRLSVHMYVRDKNVSKTHKS